MPARCPVNCILPPFMLDAIAQNGSPEQQAFARRCMAESSRMHDARVGLLGTGSAALLDGGAPLDGSAAIAGRQRIVYSANGGTSLPGQAVRREGDAATGDAAVDEAWEGSGATWDLYHDVYGRDSIDGNGLRLDSTVHYGRSFDNAFWNGQQMVYGDGDEDLPASQRLFNRFTASLDVIAHELTHGVTQFTANLEYQDQAGALNEHFSDVFGVLVKQWKLRQTAQTADWLIGSELLSANVRGSAIRSMKAPGTAYDDPVLGKDPQPGHMRDFVNTTQDYGGVHINSGIPNHAFYRVALALGGNAWERAGLIWYQALTSGRLASTAAFQQLANLTSEVAAQRFGAGGTEQQAVIRGWADVGIAVSVTPDIPDVPDTPDIPGVPEPTPPQPQPRGCNPLGFLWRRSD